MHVEDRGHYLLYSFRQGFSLTRQLASLHRPIAREPHGLSHLCLLSSQAQAHAAIPDFYMGAATQTHAAIPDIPNCMLGAEHGNPGSHVGTAHVFPAKPSPQPYVLLYCFI